VINFKELQGKAVSQWDAMQRSERPRILVGMGTCGIAAGAEDVIGALTEKIAECNVQAL